MPDIDIDFVDREKALKHFKHIRASRVDDGKLVKHNTGVYMHEVPVNAELNLCSVPHKEAEDQGEELDWAETYGVNTEDIISPEKT